jgi:hypothetical protein
MAALLTTFNPKSISGCSVWWDGADPYGTGVIPANGTSITTWTDKSGGGYNATATNAATYSSSAKCPLFNNNSYSSSYPANPANETLFIVFNESQHNRYMYMMGTTRGGRNISVNNYVFGLGIDGIAMGATSSSQINLSQTYLGLTQVSGLSSYMSLNGALTLTGPTTIPAFTSGTTTGLGTQGGNYSFYGNIMEILIYNSVLSSTDRQNVEGYLAWKWGIQTTLPSAHPYYSAAPSAVTYQNPTPVTLSTT